MGKTQSVKHKDTLLGIPRKGDCGRKQVMYGIHMYGLISLQCLITEVLIIYWGWIGAETLY